MTESPYAPPKATVEKKAIEIRWSNALPVWWSFAWRGFLYGVLGGFALGAVGGAIAVATGVPEKAQFYGSIGGYIASIPATMLAVKQALSKHLASLAAVAVA